MTCAIDQGFIVSGLLLEISYGATKAIALDCRTRVGTVWSVSQCKMTSSGSLWWSYSSCLSQIRIYHERVGCWWVSLVIVREGFWGPNSGGGFHGMYREDGLCSLLALRWLRQCAGWPVFWINRRGYGRERVPSMGLWLSSASVIKLQIYNECFTFTWLWYFGNRSSILRKTGKMKIVAWLPWMALK